MIDVKVHKNYLQLVIYLVFFLTFLLLSIDGHVTK